MLTVRVDLEPMKAQMNDLQRKHVPFAAATALNAVAERARQSVVGQMRAKLHMPTEYALNSMFLKLATRGSKSKGTAPDLTAMVFVKDYGRVSRGKRTTLGKSQAEVIGHLFAGGGRKWKNFEAALMYAGILPRGMAIVPGEGAQLDANGNIHHGFFMQMMSYFKANQSKYDWMTDEGRSSFGKSMGKKAGIGGAPVDYFVSRGRGNWFGRRSWKHGRLQHLPPGIWMRATSAFGTAIKPVIMFVRKPTGYQRYFDLEVTAEQALVQHWQAEWNLAWAKAMATAGKLGPNATRSERVSDFKAKLQAAGLG